MQTKYIFKFGKKGFGDWRHLSMRLESQECTMNSWTEASIRLGNFSGIAKQLQK